MIPIESFLFLTTTYILYALIGGITNDIALALAGGVGDNNGEIGRAVYQMCRVRTKVDQDI